jgi:hypothetical protein
VTLVTLPPVFRGRAFADERRESLSIPIVKSPANSKQHRTEGTGLASRETLRYHSVQFEQRKEVAATLQFTGRSMLSLATLIFAACAGNREDASVSVFAKADNVAAVTITSATATCTFTWQSPDRTRSTCLLCPSDKTFHPDIARLQAWFLGIANTCRLRDTGDPSRETQDSSNTWLYS